MINTKLKYIAVNLNPAAKEKLFHITFAVDRSKIPTITDKDLDYAATVAAEVMMNLIREMVEEKESDGPIQ
jgi:hypothetical protein